MKVGIFFNEQLIYRVEINVKLLRSNLRNNSITLAFPSVKEFIVQPVLEDHSDRPKKNKQVPMPNARVTLRSD